MKLGKRKKIAWLKRTDDFWVTVYSAKPKATDPYANRVDEFCLDELTRFTGLHLGPNECVKVRINVEIVK